jgi:hypothetical protein
MEQIKDSRVLGIRIAIEYARQCNFPDEKSPLNRMMHGTEFLHGLMKEGIIDVNLYQQLKRLAEDPTLEYEIIIT